MEKEQKKLSTGVVVLIVTLVVALVTVSTILAYKILNEEETNKPLTEVNSEQKEIEESKTEDKEENKVVEKEDAKENIEKTDDTSKDVVSQEKNNELEKISFTISKIEINEDGYTISAHILADEGKKVTKEDYENLKNGGTISYRGREWMFFDEREYSERYKQMVLVEKDSKEEHNESIAFDLYYDAETKEYRTGLVPSAGKKADPGFSFRDYKTEDVIELKVGKEVKIGYPWAFLQYNEEDGEIKIKYFEEARIPNEETTKEFMENFSMYDAVSYAGECEAYIINGEIVAIMCDG